MSPLQRVAVVLLIATVLAVVWLMRDRDRAPPPENDPPADAAPVTSNDCRDCHLSQYDSWHKTYHRTMTREASPDTVKGDFGNVDHDHRGFRTKFTRDGGGFQIEVVDPNWAAAFARAEGKKELAPPVRTVKLSVDRVVGSHWIQELLHRDPTGRYIRLPVLYHIGDRRWVHSLGAFLAPDSDDFWARSRGANWNESCLYCHNTEPIKNPVRDPRGAQIGYETEVTELGIACAACHGPSREHVRTQRARQSAPADVIQPARLPVARRDEICGHCHGALVPKPAAWDRKTHRDPFIPGRPLGDFYHVFRSEAEQMKLARGTPRTERMEKPHPDDGRFWGDGTPLTTALEFNGMSMSACYQDGTGAMSCLSCHTMHGTEPDHMLKPGMRTNAACLQCHPGYRERLAEHTRHAADSPGSLCQNCHMPHQTFSLMTTHRSHRIQIPDLAGSVGTGKPHACNLCHLDKSLGWTREELAKWPNGSRHAVGILSGEEQRIASSIAILSRGDARSRAVMAGAFSRKEARLASGTDWMGSMATRLMADERYPVVRDLLHRGLPAANGDRPPYDFLGLPATRSDQLKSLRMRFDEVPVRRILPFIPLGPDGLPDEAALRMLRRGRADPDLTINE